MPPVERLIGKQRLVHAVDQVHAGIRQPLALLSDIEIPGGARVRETGNHLTQVMHAAQRDTWVFAGARHRLAEHFGIASQNLEQPNKGVVPPGHHIGEHQSPALRHRNSRLELRQIAGVYDCGLVGEHVQAGFESGDDPLDLPAVAA